MNFGNQSFNGNEFYKGPPPYLLTHFHLLNRNNRENDVNL